MLSQELKACPMCSYPCTSPMIGKAPSKLQALSCNSSQASIEFTLSLEPRKSISSLALVVPTLSLELQRADHRTLQQEHLGAA